MEGIIYENYLAAHSACKGYEDAVTALRGSLGLHEETEESRSTTSVYARY